MNNIFDEVLWIEIKSLYKDMTNEEIISNLEKILSDCDKSIDFWTKQLEKETRDDYKRACLEMIELQDKQKENYKHLIEAFRKRIREFNIVMNVPKRLIDNN